MRGVEVETQRGSWWVVEALEPGGESGRTCRLVKRKFLMDNIVKVDQTALSDGDRKEYREFLMAVRSALNNVGRLMIIGKRQIGETINRHPKQHGEATIKRLSEDLGMPNSWRDFYYCMRLAKKFATEEALTTFWEQAKDEIGRPPSWRWFKDHVLSSGKGDVGGKDEIESDSHFHELRDIENSIIDNSERLLKLREVATDIEVIRGIESLMLKMDEEREEAAQLGEVFAPPNSILWGEYLRENEGCFVCQKRPIEVAHYPLTKSAGGNDFDVLPMCHEHHIEEQHIRGTDTFWLKYRAEFCRFLFDHWAARKRFMIGEIVRESNGSNNQ